jgi:hypothetical protein
MMKERSEKVGDGSSCKVKESELAQTSGYFTKLQLQYFTSSKPVHVIVKRDAVAGEFDKAD